MKDLKNILPVNLYQKALSMENLGVNSVCWNIDDAIKVIEYLADGKQIILGGDVLKINEENEIVFAYSNWSTKFNYELSLDDFIKSAKDQSLSYIWNFIEHNKDGVYYFSIIFADENFYTKRQ